MSSAVSRWYDPWLTALAPLIWGSTYVVTTEFLPPDVPLLSAALRTLPVGLLMLLWLRQLPDRGWWGKIFLLGFLNIGVFQALLFVAAYRLPGGVAATVGAIQPLVVVILSWAVLGARTSWLSWIAAVSGMLGGGSSGAGTCSETGWSGYHSRGWWRLGYGVWHFINQKMATSGQCAGPDQLAAERRWLIFITFSLECRKLAAEY